MYKTGLCSISFRKHTAAEVAAAAFGAGLDVIEWGGDVHAKCDDADALREITALSEKYHIPCSSYGTYIWLGTGMVDKLPAHIAAARILGTNVLRVWGGMKGSADLTPADRAALYAEAAEAVEIAKKSGVTLCLEAHINTVTDSIEEAEAILREVPGLRMYWQPNHRRDDEFNLRYAEKIAPYVENVHVFNWRKVVKASLWDSRAIWVEYLRRLGPDKTLLLEFMPDDDIATLPAEADALRDIITEAQK